MEYKYEVIKYEGRKGNAVCDACQERDRISRSVSELIRAGNSYDAIGIGNIEIGDGGMW